MTQHWPTPDMRRGIGDELRHRREVLGLSVADLARRSGVHRTYVTRIEEGDANASVGVIEAMANAMNCRVQIVFTCGEYQP